MLILFVCTGNTCRSPLAEVVARKWIEQRGLPWQVHSAGVSAWDGAPASAEAVQVAHEVGLDLHGHRARPLTGRMLEQADVTLALGHSHRDAIVALAPDARPRLHVLREHATHGRESGDVRDPVGGDRSVYRHTLAEVESLVHKSLERYAEETSREPA